MSRASACKRTLETEPHRQALGPVGVSSGADLGCSSKYSIGRSSSHNTLLGAVEDRSGASFHIKQSLNVGQPIVSQVVIHQTDKAAAMQKWQTGKHGVQHSAVMGLEYSSDGNIPVFTEAVSRHWGSAPPEELSFPPDAGSCGLLISCHDGGVCPPPSKAAPHAC